MTGARTIWLLVFTLAACAADAPDEIAPFYESSKADGNRPRLRFVDRDKLGVDEPSDLAFADSDLFTVSDAHSKIYEVSRSGNVKDVIDVEGSDLEALAIDPRTGEFVIADETSGKIWFLDRDGERVASLEIDSADDGNSGIEGLAFDDDGLLYAAKEKNPARIYVFDGDGVEIDREKIEFAADISALAWNADDGHLYVLSDADQSLFRLDRDFDVDAAWRLPMEQPEGIAFEGNTLWVASDSEERLYEFTLGD